MIALALGRFLARTPWSSAMALFGVTLGVISIVSVHLISASISQRLDGLVPVQLAGFSHFLHRSDIASSHYFELRRAWRKGQLEGVTAIAPLIDETTDIEGSAVRVIGVDLFNPALVPEASSKSNKAFDWLGVWVDESLIDKLDLPVNGILDAPPGTLITDIGPAQEILGWPPSRLSFLSVQINDTFQQTIDLLENVMPGFGSGFPSRTPAVALPDGWRLTTIAEQHPARAFGKSVLFNISALGLLALLVAWLLIYQVAVSWLRRLWPVFERLHVLGADWAMLRHYFLVGMIILATVSSVVGIGLGLLLAQWLLKAAMPLENIKLQLDAWVVIKALGSSLSVCILGGLFAFHRAAQKPSSSLPALITLCLLLIAAGYCLLEPATGLAGGFFSIAVLSLASGFTVIPLLRSLRRVSSWIKGPYLARLSLRESIWYPQEVGAALSGLILAVATAIGVGLMVESFRADFAAMLERRLDYDMVAEGDHAALAALEQKIASNSSVNRYQVYRDTEIRIRGLPVSLRVARVDDQEARRYGEFDALTATEVLLSEQAARMLDLDVGSTIKADDSLMSVAGIFSGFGDVQPRVVLDQGNTLAGAASKIESIGVKTSDPQALLSRVRVDFPGLELRLQTEIRRAAMDTFDQTFAITTVLIAIALLVATLSIYIAVTSMRLNRRTGSRLLLTLGVNRVESIGMDFALGIGIGLVALTLAVPLGLLFGWILCNIINPRAFGWTIELQLVGSALLQPVLMGLAAAVFAGLLRGGRAEEGYANVRR